MALCIIRSRSMAVSKAGLSWVISARSTPHRLAVVPTTASVTRNLVIVVEFAHGPAVGGCGVVHHEVQTQADASLAQLGGKRIQILVATQRGVHVVKFLDGIAIVVVGMRHLQQWHQMQVGKGSVP